MANDNRPIAVTGLGVVTSLGKGLEENWRRLVAGESGIHRINRFPTDGLRTTISGSVDFLGNAPITPPAHCYAMAEEVISEALAQSGLGDDGTFPGELFIAAPPIEHDWVTRRNMCDTVKAGDRCVYTTSGEFAPTEGDIGDGFYHFFNGTLGDRLAERFGFQGSPITLTTACASGATAIQQGVEAIRRGVCGAALAVGTDGSLQEEALVRFSLLSALSTKNDEPEKASKPFSKNRDGFVMAEGAGALVLEDPEHARARGATILALIGGCGEAADTFHRTRSNPNGHAIIRSMQGALDDAGLSPDAIGYINAHGTSTSENDKMEYFGTCEVFGARSDGKLPVSSNKSMIGHTLSAAGAVEAAFSVKTLMDGTLPPTINYDVPDPALPLDVVPNVARKASPDFVLSNSFGFGGQNTSIVFGHADQ
jgi:3-oxoacyl-[acyl-carrier-protein] synthase II